MNSSPLYALTTLSGTIIGVGLFVLPYITAQVGIWIILGYFLLLCAITVIIHLFYAEIVMRTAGQHRFTGYAEIYLGPIGRNLSMFTAVLGLGGALFSYMIIGSNFLSSITAHFLGQNQLIYIGIFLLVGSILIYSDIKGISKIELLGFILFFIILFIIFLKGLPFIKLNNLSASLPLRERPLFLPYGAIFFALWGAALIPETVEMMKGQLKTLKILIPLAILIPAITYLIFILLITGITGPLTSKDAITGLKDIFGDGIVSLALSFGILTTFTSFITLGMTLKKILWYDLKIPSFIAWLSVCLTPLLLYIFGLKDFLKVIGLIGGVMIGIDGILIILIYLKSKIKSPQSPAWSLNLPKSFIICLVVFFIIGIIYEIYYFIK